MTAKHLANFTKEVDPQGFVSVNRAAKLLDISPFTIYKWIKAGKFKGIAFKIGGNIRLKVNEFLRWIDINAMAN